MALFFLNYTPTSHCQSICYLDMRPKAFKYHRQAQVGSCSWHMFTENFSRASLLPPIPPPTIVNYSPPANNKPPDSEQVNLFPPTNISRKPRGKSQRMVRTWWGTAKRKKTKQPRRSCSRRHFPIFVIYQVWQHCAACCQGWKLHHAGLVDFHPTKSTSFYNQWTPHNLLVSKSI